MKEALICSEIGGPDGRSTTFEVHRQLLRTRTTFLSASSLQQRNISRGCRGLAIVDACDCGRARAEFLEHLAGRAHAHHFRPPLVAPHPAVSDVHGVTSKRTCRSDA